MELVHSLNHQWSIAHRPVFHFIYEVIHSLHSAEGCERVFMRFRSMIKTDEDKLEGFGYYSQQGAASKRAHNLVVLIALVLVWYCGAVITITTTKVIMNATKLPFLLCTVQFVFASVLANLYIRLTKPGVANPLPSGISSIVFQISVSYTFGFILTNIAFSIGKNDDMIFN